jgi:hypothetical protein
VFAQPPELDAEPLAANCGAGTGGHDGVPPGLGCGAGGLRTIEWETA